MHRELFARRQSGIQWLIPLLHVLSPSPSFRSFSDSPILASGWFHQNKGAAKGKTGTVTDFLVYYTKRFV